MQTEGAERFLFSFYYGIMPYQKIKGVITHERKNC
jgi:hypothetical protein